MRFLVLLLVLSLLFAGKGCEQDPPEQVLAAYVEFWLAGDYGAMYALLSAEAQAACSEELFITRHRNISLGIGMTGLKLMDFRWEGGLARYRLAFETTTVGEFNQDYSLALGKEAGNWRLDWDHCHIFPGLTASRVVRVTREMPRRGAILDANCKPLACEGTYYEIGLVDGNPTPATVTALSRLLAKSEAELGALLGPSAPADYRLIATLASEDWEQLRPALTALPGVLARAKNGRIYRAPASLAQTVGYIGEATATGLGELAGLGFEAGDVIGRLGLELICNGDLAGRPGFSIVIHDESGNTWATIARRPVVQGADVVTTLDLNKCELLDGALGDWSGSLLLIDYNDGDILGVASKPGFDANLFNQGISAKQYEEMLALATPFVNRPFNGLYPPGSVFKPFTALMALEQNVFDPDRGWDTPVHWQGGADWGSYRVTRVLRPPGPVDLREAMRWSDNVYFADLGLKVGWQAFRAYGQQLGFDSPAPFPLCSEWSMLGEGEGSVLLADSSYGQGKLLTTPLHVALMYASIARGDGVMPRPRLLADTAKAAWLETHFRPENIQLLDAVLAYVASDGASLATAGGSARGKTGTSEISRSRQIAWFVCYFERKLLVVTLEGDSSLSSLQAVQVARHCLGLGIGSGN